MAGLPSATEQADLESLIKTLEIAWNAGDGAAFAEPMAPDADFVTVRGEHHHGRQAIASGHAGIFRSIYAGSLNRYTVESARLLRPDVALVHVRSALQVPTGPLAGSHAALFSVVATREAGTWLIASFHNTLCPTRGA